MENSQKKRKKVKDIFPPHQLSRDEKAGEEKEESIKIKHLKEIPERKIEETESEESITVITSPLKEKTLRKEKTGKRSKILVGVGLLFLSVIFYYLGFIILARAEVNITTKKIEIPFSGIVLIDKNVSSIDFSKAIIPGNLFIFKANESQEFSSTGHGKDERKAKGIITIYNNYSTSPQILVATTRFETPDNKIFRLDSRIVIPGATTKNGELIPSTIDVKVTADKPGPDYNIEACNLPDCKFTIPGFAGTSKFKDFYGVSTAPMAGGSLGSALLVTSEDLKNAEEVIMKKIMNSIDQDLQNKIPPELKVFQEAKSGINITKLSSDADLGDYREKFTVTAEAEIKVIAFNENHLIGYIQQALEKDKDENYDYCQNPELEYLELKTDFDKGTLKISFKTNQVTCHKLSLDEIKRIIVNKDRKALDQIFQSNPGIEEVKIKLWPWWIKKVPNSLQKIKIFIDPHTK